MKRLLFVLLLSGALGARAEEPLTRIAFGSCGNQRRPQPIWQAINGLKPQLFIFMGDNVYADTTDPAKLRESYNTLGAMPEFAKLRANTPVVATWDDHDYGKNDAGAEWEGKEASKEAFMEFFKTPDDSPLRKRGGVYDAKIFGPEGKRVQVILLDTRWFRGPLKRMSKPDLKELRKDKGKWQGPYLAPQDSDSTMLGEAQWKWLSAQLQKPAELRLVISSIQVAAVDHGWEKWGNLPQERRRLLRLIKETGAGGVVFLSGDRHAAEISELPPGTDGGPRYPLFDVTSSGLNQKGLTKERNRFRIDQRKCYGAPNFGMIFIDWSKYPAEVSLQIRGLSGKVVRQNSTSLGALSAN